MEWSLLESFKWQIALILSGLLLAGSGIFISQYNNPDNAPQVEIIEASANPSADLIIEVSGAVEKPGVYKLPAGSRTEDALIAAEGVTDDADKTWMERYMNRAAELTDGQKVFIPRRGEQSNTTSASSGTGESEASGVIAGTSSGAMNINTATQAELEELWGIGPVYAQKIIEHRPYSSVDELLSKDIIKQNVYDRNKDLLTVY